jgi:hypothetical protein
MENGLGPRRIEGIEGEEVCELAHGRQTFKDHRRPNRAGVVIGNSLCRISCAAAFQSTIATRRKSRTTLTLFFFYR